MNNTASLDLKSTTNNGQLLWLWLGGFWQKVYQNPNFARDMQSGQGLLSIQLYLNFLESMNRINRNDVPVFHRERWKPVRLLKSQAGTGALLTIGASPMASVGPQVSADYVYGATFKLGGTSALSATVSYQLTGVQDIVSGICSSIISPKSVLVAGTDFVIRDSTIFFLKERDPFSDPNFPTRRVSTHGVADEELVLWCMDTLEEHDYVYNQLGYVFGVKLESSTYYAELINRIWDLYNLGTPIQTLKSALGAILSEPCVVDAQETVVKVLTNEDSLQVITNARVYTLPVNAVLRSVVAPGAVLIAGDYLTETIRLYYNINPQKLSTCGEYGVRFRTDVPAMFFGPQMFKSSLKFGVGASFELSDIVSVGNDANGNPKLKFDLFGDAQDIATFWADFWAYCETNNISSATCFADYLDTAIGTTYGRVAPLEYCLRYFLRPNLFMVVVDQDRLSPTGYSNMNQLQLLKAVMPAHVLMLVTTVRSMTDDYDLSTNTEVIENMVSLAKSDEARPGGPSSLSLTYRDRYPIVRWIPTCR